MNATGRKIEKRAKHRAREVNREVKAMSTAEIVQAAAAYLRRMPGKYHNHFLQVPLIELAKNEVSHKQIYGY